MKLLFALLAVGFGALAAYRILFPHHSILTDAKWLAKHFERDEPDTADFHAAAYHNRTTGTFYLAVAALCALLALGV